METILGFLPSAGTIFVVVVGLWLTDRLLRRGGVASGQGFRNQLVMLGLTAAGVLVVLLVIPIGEATRGQLLGFLGVVLSAAIALSSTTFLGNALAGIMMRVVKNFRIGDFIRAGEHFGRVTERGLFHTEIQTENRELTTLPNMFLVTTPVSTIRTSGTVIAAKVSLGYDVQRGRVEGCLKQAAERAGLQDPFVQVLELGDFSVVYRVAGILTDIKQLVSASSRLRGSVMDLLHEAGIEIISPNFMNTRAVLEGIRFIPEASPVPASTEEVGPEEVVFDKAEKAESLEKLRESHGALSKEIEDLEEILETMEDGERPARESELGRLRAQRDELAATIEGESEAQAKTEE